MEYDEFPYVVCDTCGLPQKVNVYKKYYCPVCGEGVRHWTCRYRINERVILEVCPDCPVRFRCWTER